MCEREIRAFVDSLWSKHSKTCVRFILWHIEREPDDKVEKGGAWPRPLMQVHTHANLSLSHMEIFIEIYVRKV